MSDIADKIYAATGLTLDAEEAAKIGQMIQQARRDGREEAARWHDEEVEYFAKMGREVSPRDVTIGLMHHMEAGKHRNYAAAIRALGEKECKEKES